MALKGTGESARRGRTARCIVVSIYL